MDSLKSLVVWLVAISVIGCGKSEKVRRASPNVIEKDVLATLQLKDCESGPCADDPCAKRGDALKQGESPTETSMGKLVRQFNDGVCKERPWRGYLLMEEIVKHSVEAQLSSIPEKRRSDFASFISGSLSKDTELEFISDTSCQIKGGTKYFFPRLSIMDPWETINGVTSQGGYSLPVGNDIEEPC